LIARANHHVTFPARFQLIGAMNPCRCGHLGDADLECTKAPRCAGDYQSKISGPMLDRIDIQVDVPAVKVEELNATGRAESSAQVAARVMAAREIQTGRFANLPFSVNSHTDTKTLEEIAPMSAEAKALLNRTMELAKLSARGYYRVLRVARTIADLAGGADIIAKPHIAEALSYRRTALN
jgi:magnesium chelatase family protein